MAGGSNPKFLKYEKKVPYNIRLPQRLIDKYNSYADLTGNTTTNIINKLLDDFISDKVVMNDYLDVGGVLVKIPYAVYQKNRFINDDSSFFLVNYDLIDYNNSSEYTYIYEGEKMYETLFAKPFEIKKIPNNLDIKNGDSYVVNKSITQFNHNSIHSGIELFVYNITESIFADAKLIDKFDSFVNCLYCLYFEVHANNDVSVYLMDYLKAINLLSASGNDKYKDLIIACVMELKKIDELVRDIHVNIDDATADFIMELENIPELKFLSKDEVNEKLDELKDKHSTEIESAILYSQMPRIKKAVDDVADKYNSNNIIPFGSDIFNRLAVKEIESASAGFLDEIVDELVEEKIDAIIGERIDELLKTEKRSIDKINELDKEFNNINSKICEIHEKLDKIK